MNGLTAHEWVRATIVADVFHWGVVGLLMLVGLLVQRWLARRALRRQGAIPVVPTPWRSPDRICPDCHAHHYCHAPRPKDEDIVAPGPSQGAAK